MLYACPDVNTVEEVAMVHDSSLVLGGVGIATKGSTTHAERHWRAMAQTRQPPAPSHG